MADSIATQIAAAVIEQLKAEGLIISAATPQKGGKPPKETVPATTDDEPTGTAPERKRATKAKKPEPEPEPEEDEEEDEDEDEDTDDLTTEEQRALVEDTVTEASEDDIRSELLDYYVAQGHEKDEISGTLADMSEEELRMAYTDYCARLLTTDEDGGFDFIDDFEAPYKATRIFEGEEKLVWARGAVTLSEEEVEAEDLGDPNETKKKKKAPPARKSTKRPAKK